MNFTQIGASTFTGKINANGGIATNNISFGDSNTDPASITKYTYGLNVSELALCPGDDPSGDTIALPVSGETVQDYVTVRSNAGIHHAFSTSGNYYCAGNIIVNGTVTASAFIGTSSNAIGTILNSDSFSSLPLPVNGVYRLKSIVLSVGTWIVTSQIQMSTGEASNVRVAVSVFYHL